MEVLVMHGSKRKNGNTGLLASEFIRGAEEAGHQVERVELGDMQFGDCLGCMACWKNPGKCVQKDDMTAVLEKFGQADAIVFASPMYFFSWTSLMKRGIDRLYPYMTIAKDKTFCLITAGGVPEAKLFDNMLRDFQKYVECFNMHGGENNRNGGYILGKGALAPGNVKESVAMQEAYEIGKNLGKN